MYYISLLCLKYVGGSAIGSVFRDTVDKESISVLTSALKNGFNLIDTAPWYGFGKSETVWERLAGVWLMIMVITLLKCLVLSICNILFIA